MDESPKVKRFSNRGHKLQTPIFLGLCRKIIIVRHSKLGGFAQSSGERGAVPHSVFNEMYTCSPLISDVPIKCSLGVSRENLKISLETIKYGL